MGRLSKRTGTTNIGYDIIASCLSHSHMLKLLENFIYFKIFLDIMLILTCSLSMTNNVSLIAANDFNCIKYDADKLEQPLSMSPWTGIISESFARVKRSSTVSLKIKIYIFEQIILKTLRDKAYRVNKRVILRFGKH